MFICDLNSQNKYSIGLSYYPNYSVQTIRPDSLNSIRFHPIKEMPIFANAFGLNARYKCSRILYAKLGLLYSERGTEVTLTKSNYSGPDFFNDYYKIKYRYVYLDVPLDVQLKHPFKNKERAYLVTNVGFTYKLRCKSYYIAEKDGVKESKVDETKFVGFPSYYKKNSVCVNIGFGLGFKVKALDFIIQPLYRHDITPALKVNHVRMFQSSLGLETSCFLSLEST